MKPEQIRYICDRLTAEQLIDMVIEECSELIQACCKVKREANGNYTPKSRDEVYENLIEELADTALASYVLEYFISNNDYIPSKVRNIMGEKLERWAKRLEAKEDGKIT